MTNPPGRFACALVLTFAFFTAPVAAQTIALDPAWRAAIGSVLLVGPEEPKNYSAVSASRRGVTSAAMIVSMELTLFSTMLLTSEAEGDLRRALQDQDLRLGEDMQAAIEAALETQGHSVDRHRVERRRTNGLMKNYFRVRTGADAILDVGIHSPVYTNFRKGRVAPAIVIDVRIVSGKGHTTLFEQSFLYQDAKPEGPGAENFVWLPVDAKYVFPSFDAAAAKPALAAEGIRAAAPKIAAAIANVLKD